MGFYLRKVHRLERKLAKRLDRLSGLVSVCAYCKKVRIESSDTAVTTTAENGHRWVPIETYFYELAKTQFSHGMCPHCEDEVHRKEFGESAPGKRPVDMKVINRAAG